MFGEKTLPAQIFQDLAEPDFRKSEKVIREIRFENRVETRSQFLVRARTVLSSWIPDPPEPFIKTLDFPESRVTPRSFPPLAITYPPENVVFGAAGSKSYVVPI